MEPPEYSVPTKPMVNEDIDDGEELPLYENLQPTSSGLLAVPETRATPNEVQSFITQLLIEKRGLSVEDARSVASRWTRGNGQDLIDYPPRMYLEIFGHEDGYMVYKEVHLFHRQNIRDNDDRGSPYLLLGLLVLIGFVPIAILTSRAGPWLKTIAVYLGIFILVTIFFVLKAEWCARYPGKLEDEIHQELSDTRDDRN